MAILTLPLTNHPDAETVFTLEGVNYIFHTLYNERGGAWYLDVSLEDGTPLVASRKIVVKWPLMGVRETPDRSLPGWLFAFDTSGQDLDPTLDDLGTRVVMQYLESTGW